MFPLAVPGLPVMHSMGCQWGVSFCSSPRQLQSQRGHYRDQEQSSLRVGAKNHTAALSLSPSEMAERIGRVKVRKLVG